MLEHGKALRGIATSGSGRMECPMGSEFISGPTVIDMKGILNSALSMEKELKNMLQEIFIEGIFRGARKTAMANTTGKKEGGTKATSSTEPEKGEGSGKAHQVTHTMASTKRGRKMATVFISGRMALYTGAILFQIRGKGRDRCCGKTEATTKGVGKQEISMVKVRYAVHFQEQRSM